MVSSRMQFAPGVAGGSVGGAPSVGERGVGGGEPGDRDAQRRAADVVEAEPVAEVDAARITAMLAADADVEIGARCAAPVDRDLHEVADAALVERGERVVGKDAALQ